MEIFNEEVSNDNIDTSTLNIEENPKEIEPDTELNDIKKQNDEIQSNLEQVPIQEQERLAAMLWYSRRPSTPGKP